MDRTEKVELTNMCMVYKDDMVLIQDRVDPKWKGITFPGGHVERGESFADAVIREVFEETGLTISEPKLCGIKSWPKKDGRYIVLFYKTDKFTGQIKSSDEGEVRWEKLADLPELPLANDMNDMLKIFCDDSLSEFFYYIENDTWKYVLK